MGRKLQDVLPVLKRNITISEAGIETSGTDVLRACFPDTLALWLLKAGIDTGRYQETYRLAVVGWLGGPRQ